MQEENNLVVQFGKKVGATIVIMLTVTLNLHRNVDLLIVFNLDSDPELSSIKITLLKIGKEKVSAQCGYSAWF